MIKQGISGFGMPTGVVRVIVSAMLLTACCSVSAQSSQPTDVKKPTIESAVILHIVPNETNHSYDAYYEVSYHGADAIIVSLEEEYGSKVRTWHITTPDLVVGTINDITAPYRAWIDFTAENEYGRCVYTIELLPYGEVGGYYIDGEPVASVSMPEADQVERFVVYTLSGTELCRIDSLSALSDIDYSGVVIIHRYVGSHKIGTLKIRL